MIAPKLSDVEQQFAAQNPAEAWGRYLVTAAASLPFWEQAIEHIALLTNLDKKKTANHLAAARGSFTLINNWYFELAPYVKARRDEIDSAISFIRNAALRQNVAVMPAAASARNLAGVLRVLLALSLRNYKPGDYPRLMVGGLLGLAAAKSLFPLDLSDVAAQFTKPGESQVDDINHATVALGRCAKHYNLEMELKELYKAFDALLQHIDEPQPWRLPASTWEPQTTSLLAAVHYAGMQSFHQQSTRIAD